MIKRAFIFGYGNHGRPITAGLHKSGFRVTVVESNEKNHQLSKEDGCLDTLLIDVTRDAHLEELLVEENDQLICVMDDEHLNVFLTLSLRSLYPNSFILSISDSIHTSQKLKMAGADRVIDLYEASANRIHNILKKPVATKLLDGFVSDTNEISFKGMIIPEGSFLDGIMVDDVNFRAYRVLLVGMIDKELGDNFVFTTDRIEHKLDKGDTIVCMGKDDDLERFENRIGQKETLK
ncbi:MAG: NAD-binding protein [Campylobacterota bacterium]|nr:NAD-binding protein [Campylobacterota bacterium]